MHNVHKHVTNSNTYSKFGLADCWSIRAVKNSLWFSVPAAKWTAEASVTLKIFGSAPKLINDLAFLWKQKKNQYKASQIQL